MQAGGGRLAAREAAALEKRNWVRLTRVCNNRCLFCLDSAAQDGTCVSTVEVNARIIDGVREGARRLILSGGEPTLHPDFARFVALGKKLGYQRVQTITNGRLFSYPGFVKRAVEAGLGEITFSIHGHEPRVHDELVGVPGAFDQTMAGLRNALADERLIVNVDVCLNKMNIGGLPKLLDELIERGVREFDLLHIIPFGRAYEEHASKLFYDIDEALPAIEHALRLSLRDDLHIWFNRFPPPYLEGYEHLIQDPHKLEDEVRGRKEEIDLLIAEGVSLSCRQEERCLLCYLRNLCEALEELQCSLRRGEGRALRVTLGPQGALPPSLPPLPDGTDTIWLRAPDPAAAAKALASFPGLRLILDLDSYQDLCSHLEAAGCSKDRIAELRVSRPEDIERLLDLRLDAKIVVYLDESTAAHLERRHPKAPERLVVAGRNPALLADAVADELDPRGFFSRWDRWAPVENVPACISGRSPRPSPAVIDASVLNKDGTVDALGFTREYVRQSYRTKSKRCESCRHDSSCAGAHINLVRARGYRLLEPEFSQS